MRVSSSLFLLSLTLTTAAAKSTSSVALQTSATLAILGQPLTIAATVTPAAATGKVTFFDGVTPSESPRSPRAKHC